MYFLKFLRNYFYVKEKHLSGETLSGWRKSLLEEGKRITENLNLLEDEYPKQNLFSMLQVLLQAGRSPERKKIRERLDSIKKEKRFEDDGSVHDGCCLCTAECIGDYLLAQKKEEVEKSLEWLKKQKKYHYKILRLKGEYESLDDIPKEEKIKIRGDHYTTEAFKISLFTGDEDFQWDVAKTLLEDIKEWKKSHEVNPLCQLSDILYVFNRFVEELKKRDKEENGKNRIEKLKNLLKEEGEIEKKQYNGKKETEKKQSGKEKEIEKKPRYEIIKDYIIELIDEFKALPQWTQRDVVHGLLIPDFWEIISRMTIFKRKNAAPSDYSENMNKSAQDTLSKILKDPVYERIEDLWATDLDHTRDWTLNWLRYWEYYLKKRENEQD